MLTIRSSDHGHILYKSIEDRRSVSQSEKYLGFSVYLSIFYSFMIVSWLSLLTSVKVSAGCKHASIKN